MTLPRPKPALPWIVAACLALTVSCSTMAHADDEARLLRFPAIHGDRVVFTYAGDLYTVSCAGRRGAKTHQ